MPIYMDLHIVPGITAENAAKAHLQDLRFQDEFDCNCMTYWVDETKNSAFCLIEAPNPDAVKNLHNKAHGLITHQILEVNSTVVESFLGRIYDPDVPSELDTQLKVFNDPAFRVLVLLSHNDAVLMALKYGKDKSNNYFQSLYAFIDHAAKTHEGSTVRHTQDMLLSFTSAFKAIDFAKNVHSFISENKEIQTDVKVVINAGMPVTDHKTLFGETIDIAKSMLYIKALQPIVLAPIINEISTFKTSDKSILKTISEKEEETVYKLITVLENNYHLPLFKVQQIAELMFVSKSGLNRLIKQLTGHSPKTLLKHIRLYKSLTYLKKQQNNVSETATACGFESPAYFSKCFLKHFKIVPSQYQKLAQEL